MQKKTNPESRLLLLLRVIMMTPRWRNGFNVRLGWQQTAVFSKLRKNLKTVLYVVLVYQCQMMIF